MPRHPRIHIPGGFYHTILRGNGRQAIFFDEEDRSEWQRLLHESLERYQHRLHAYCWMTNHVHMAIQAGAEPLAGFMRLLASRYARLINRKNQRPGHLFERRYRAILVQQDGYLKELVRYIHLNPVRAGIVACLADYRWSSHHDYLHSTDKPWLTTDCLVAMFGESQRSARRAYRAFMSDPVPHTTLQLLRNGVSGDERILGDDGWARDILDKYQGIPRQKTLDEIIGEICMKHRISGATLASPSRSRRHSTIRAEIALAATRNGCATVTEVARRFGRTHSGLSRVLNRLRDTGQ